MATEQLEPGPNGWSPWTYFQRRFSHVCCNCLEQHDVRMKIDDRGRIWMKWKTDKRATAARRRGRK